MSKSSSMGRGMMAILAVGARHGPDFRAAPWQGSPQTWTKTAARCHGTCAPASRRDSSAGLPSGPTPWTGPPDRRPAADRARLHTNGGAALEQLALETDEGCFLGVLHGQSTVTIGESVPASSNLVGSWLGRPYPAYCSDAGQAALWEASEAEVRTVFAGVDFVRHGPNTPSDVDDFLGRLAAARARGYSVVDEEAEPGLYSLAVPVRDFMGEVAAALQIVGTKARLEPRRTEFAAALVEQGRWLEARLGFVPGEQQPVPESGQN